MLLIREEMGEFWTRREPAPIPKITIHSTLKFWHVWKIRLVQSFLCSPEFKKSIFTPTFALCLVGWILGGVENIGRKMGKIWYLDSVGAFSGRIGLPPAVMG